MKRLIAVCYIGGRCGSSLTMGLLQLSGFDVGNIGTVTCPNNEKGYFEVFTFQSYVLEVIPELKGFQPMVRFIPKNIKIVKKHRYDFSLRFKDWFKGDQIAVKCPYYLPMYLFPKEYKVTIISLKRELESQAKSIKKLNNGQGDFRKWLMDWQVKIDKYFKHDIEIDFDEWISEPYKTYLRMCEVVKPPKVLSKSEVLGFIDPKLKHF